MCLSAFYTFNFNFIFGFFPVLLSTNPSNGSALSISSQLAYHPRQFNSPQAVPFASHRPSSFMLLFTEATQISSDSVTTFLGIFTILPRLSFASRISQLLFVGIVVFTLSFESGVVLRSLVHRRIRKSKSKSKSVVMNVPFILLYTLEKTLFHGRH